MTWLIDLVQSESVAHAVLFLSLTIATGLALGKIQVRGIGLGVGGVLFSGLVLGHFKLGGAPEILEFVRDFGLILFVYAIGLQVGPGFFASLRRQGLRLNLMALAVVLGGTAVAVAIMVAKAAPVPVGVGLLTGAVTNTPSLGAAQQALKDIPAATGSSSLVSIGYAVAYPFGILGTILAIVLLRRLFRVDVASEAAEFERLQHADVSPIEMRDFVVSNPNLDNQTITKLSELTGSGAVVTRIYHEGAQQLAEPHSTLHAGDVVHVVGVAAKLDNFRVIVGRDSDIKLPDLPSEIHSRRVVVTQKRDTGKTLAELELAERFGVIATRVVRSGIEFSPTKTFRIHFGDRLMLVGVQQALESAARELGDSLQELDKPQMIPIFVGIALGVVVGSIPFAIPSIPAPVRLGLAGGPLIVAILMGRFVRIGPLLSYMPNPSKIILRDFGISLFLAAVGLKAGERLYDILASGDGLYWMGLATFITFVPVFLVGVYGRLFAKLNFVALCGVLTGSMTDPPALMYASQMVGDDSPSVAYATVYPATMLARVVIAQVLVIIALG